MPAAARDRDFPALAASGHKWAHVQVIKGVRRLAAADLDRPADGPVRHDPVRDGPRAQTLHLVLVHDPVGLAELVVSADNVLVSRVVRKCDPLEICGQQLAQECNAPAPVIDRALLHGRDNVRVSAECNVHPHCPGRLAELIDLVPGVGPDPATLPASAIGLDVRVVALVPVAPAKTAVVFDPVDRDKVVVEFDPVVQAKMAAEFDPEDQDKAVAEFGPIDPAAVLGQAKMVAVNKSARTDRMVDPDDLTALVDPAMAIDQVGPVTVGLTWPTVRSSAAAIVLGGRTVPIDPAATGGRRIMVAVIAPGVRMETGDGTTTIITITGTTIGTIIGTTTTSTIITTTGITAAGAATGRTTGTCPPQLE